MITHEKETSDTFPLPSAPKEARSNRLRLDYLDGLRGLAALYVMLFHAWYVADYWRGGVPEIVTQAGILFRFGRYAVAVFIVLSGYCLMLPVARSADGALRGGFGDYITRRARRILPPYYAALILSLMVIALIPDMNRKLNVPWDQVLPAFTPGVLLSHLFVVHNLHPAWLDRINGSLWSVATEWQIYFIFPALLLPLWRRFGVMAAVLIAFAVGLAPHFLPGGAALLDGAAPWFLGLFALGMAAAVFNFSQEPRLIALRQRVPWLPLSGLCAIAFVLTALLRPAWVYYTNIWTMDIVVGLGAMCLIIYCTRHLLEQPDAPKPDILAVLESRAAVSIGAFSYSLYLMHAPVIGVLHLAIRKSGLAPLPSFALLVLSSIPLCLGIAYLFHLAFERRFMPGHLRTGEKKAKATTLPSTP